MATTFQRSQQSVTNRSCHDQYGLIIYPPSLQFNNVQRNEASIAKVSIQNVSSTLKKIRIVGVLEAHKKYFRVAPCSGYRNLSPGCSLDVTATFLCTHALTHSIYTKLRIAIKDGLDDGHLSIDAVANVPCADIVCDTVLDFKAVPVQQQHSKPLRLRNIGCVAGKFRFEVPSEHQQSVCITPSEGELDGNAERDVQVTLTAPDTVGIFRCSLSLLIDDDNNNGNDDASASARRRMHSIDVLSNICRPSIDFLTVAKPQQKIERIQFGHLYLGQRRTFRGVLMNNGPNAVHYSIYLRPHDDDDTRQQNAERSNNNNTHYEAAAAAASPQNSNMDRANAEMRAAAQGEFDEDAQPIRIDREEGTLQAYASEIVTIVYMPPLQPKRRGFKSTVNAHDELAPMQLLLVIESGSTQTLRIPLQGLAMPAMFTLSPSDRLTFGECAVHDRRDLYVQLSNGNEHLALTYRAHKVAAFHCTPSSGTLLPLQSMQILVSFAPKQLGTFKNARLRLVFNGDARTFTELLLQGCATHYPQSQSQSQSQTVSHFGARSIGGTDKLPIDFKPRIKVLDPLSAKPTEITAVMKDVSNLQFTTELTHEQTLFYRPPWNASLSTKHGLFSDATQKNVSAIHASSTAGNSDAPDVRYTFVDTEVMRRTLNQKHYNRYLVEMRRRRRLAAVQTQKTSNAKFDPNAVARAQEDEDLDARIERDALDIGLDMDAYYGAYEPKLALPQANNNDDDNDADESGGGVGGSDALYLGDGQVIRTHQDRMNFFQRCMSLKSKASSASSSSSLSIDEHRLVKNKFKCAPETNAEIIDCQSTLTRKELKQLQFAPKNMHFGQLCIHAHSLRNFGIVNTLKKTILVQVRIASAHQHYIQSTPLAQVVPAQNMAGFDIGFTAQDVGAFESDLIFVINGVHTISCRLSAEIVAMDLAISTDRLRFEFPTINCLEFQLTQHITLKNMLAAPATFHFDTGGLSSGGGSKEMTIKPCSGVVQPNKSQSVQFIWAPATLRASNRVQETEHTLLQIVDGVADKRIEIETVLPLAKCVLSHKSMDFGAVAVGTEHTKRVQLRNNGHIQAVFRVTLVPSDVCVYPLCAKIEVGTSVTLSVTYMSCSAAQFNEHILVEIRGGKTLKLNVCAQTVVPKVSIKQHEFEFGGVTIGDTKELPIEVMNDSNVDCHLFLEMTANQLYKNGTFDISYPSEWNELGTDPQETPVLVLPPVEDDQMHSFVRHHQQQQQQQASNGISNESSTKSLRSSRHSSRRSLAHSRASRKSLLSSGTSADVSTLPMQYRSIPIVRSLDNPDLLFVNDNQNETAANKKPLTVRTTDAAAGKSARTNAAPKSTRRTMTGAAMLRRGSLTAMSQHLALLSSEETEQHAINSEERTERRTADADDDTDTIGDNEQLRYRLLITANSSLSFKLTFTPKCVRHYDFDLNIRMAGIAFDDPTTMMLRKCVFAHGLKPRIAVSTRSVSLFDVTVLSDSRSGGGSSQLSSPYYKEIEISNQERNAIEWKLQMQDNMHHVVSNSAQNLPWRVEPNAGCLSSLGVQKVTIYFRPCTDQLFRDSMDLLLSTPSSAATGAASAETESEHTTTVFEKYVCITLEGQASFPRLSLSEEFIMLPTVPLQCKSRKRVMLRNHGYENLEIRYEIIDERAASLMCVRFPNGRILGGNAPDELAVEIECVCPTSAAVTTRIDFMDMDNNRFSLFVSAMSDNCILSNQPFLYRNECVIAVDRSSSSQRKENHKDVITVPRLTLKHGKNKRSATAAAAAVMTNSTSLIPDDIPKDILSDICVLIRYLNANCFLKLDPNIDAFPTDIIQCDGAMVFDLVHFLSGKKVSNLRTSSNRSHSNTSEQLGQAHIETLIHNYSQLLNFLKAHGALLTIRPEYCLSCAHYIQFIQISCNMSLHDGDDDDAVVLQSSKIQSDLQRSKQTAESVHPMLSYVCWSQILFQIVKLFVLQKITLQSFVKQAHIAPLIEENNTFLLRFLSNQAADGGDDVVVALNEERLQQSNVYSVHENLLLLWLSVCYNLQLRTPVSDSSEEWKFFESFSELRNGVAIVYLLQWYAPHLKALHAVHTTTTTGTTNMPLTEAQRTENASLIIHAMKRLGLHIALDTDDITKCVERNMCLLLLYLYQHLNKYQAHNQKNVLRFDGVLNQEIVRKLHVVNPSKNTKLCYELILEGDPQFVLKTPSFVVLAPKAMAHKKSTAKNDNVAVKAQLQENVENKNKNKKNDHTSRVSSAKTNKSELIQNVPLEPETDIFISYTPRFVRASDARLTLLAKPAPDAEFPCKVPDTLTFELKAVHIESKPTTVVQCTGKLYESTKVAVQVVNPFDADCEFEIIIKDIAHQHHNNNRTRPPMIADDKPCVPSPWHCDRRSIKIEAKQSMTLTVEYLPFVMGTQMACLSFVDRKYGEFLYHICGEAQLPSSIEDIKLKCKDSDSITHDIDFESAFLNPMLLKARRMAAERSAKQNPNLRQKMMDYIDKVSLQSNPVMYRVEISSHFFVAAKQLIVYNDDAHKDNRFRITFNAKQSNGCYPCCIKFESAFVDGANGVFNLGDVRIYNVEVLVQSQGTRAELEFECHAMQTVTQRIPVVNNSDSEWKITAKLSGDATSDFNVGGATATSNNEFMVPAKQTGFYELIYAPKWTSEQATTAQLSLYNHATNESYVYDLHCHSGEPLAVDHVCLQCKAKSSVEHVLEVPNPYYPRSSVMYAIESDLPGICGDNQLSIEAQQECARYKLCVTPQSGGTLHGSVSFMEQSPNQQRFQWFAVELVCSAPDPEKVIEISAYLREVVCVEISLSNPLNKTVTFAVDIQGDGLFGDDVFELQPQQSAAMYKLHYSPLITGQVTGAVTFRNDWSGEFWYELKLIGKQPPSIQLQDMVCTIGSVCTQSIRVENPFHEYIDLHLDTHICISNDDNKCFSLQTHGQKRYISIAPSSMYNLSLVYKPSSIGVKQCCNVVLKHAKLGEWNYSVVGVGREPNIEPPTYIHAVLHSRISKVIVFHNPFEYALRICVEFEYEHVVDEKQKIFQLFLKKQKPKQKPKEHNAATNLNTTKNMCYIAPNASLQIPLFFAPNAMRRYTANLVISANVDGIESKAHRAKELVWNFPIVGLPQYDSTQLLKVSCNARETFHKIWNLALEHFSAADENMTVTRNTNEAMFDIQVQHESSSSSSSRLTAKDDSLHDIVDKSLKIELLTKKLKQAAARKHNKDDTNLFSLQMEVTFEPLRAFKGHSKLHVCTSEGIRWTFPLHIAVNAAPHDDVLRIESQLHCTRTVQLTLNLSDYIESIHSLQHDKQLQFRAYFSTDSPFEFDVSPKTGAFDVSVNTATFAVSFTPTEYGAALIGTLIVETANMEWSYRVIGTHPTYIPPNAHEYKPTVDDKISKQLQHKRLKEQNAVKRTNFLKKNISAIRPYQK